MKFKKINSGREVNVNVSKYLIDWEGREISGPQTKVRDFLRPFWKFKTVLSEFVIPGSKQRIDFLNLSDMVAVECSPSSSHSFNSFFHKNREGGFLAALKRDQGKEEWLEENGFVLVTLVDEDLKDLTKERFKTKFDCEL